MSDVQRSAYRQPVTPSGLESIEKGTLTWLDEDMYNNLNTGVLEQYLDCLLYTSPSPRDRLLARMPSSA